MTYTNSPLVTYKKLSPNKTSPRNHVIDTITIHCFVGQVTAQSGCNAKNFVNYNPLSGSSCNYVVGCDGSIGLCVEEKDRSWCSSNKANDHRAVTIEVASDTVAPYIVTDKALSSLINLCADICKRNNIKELKWLGNKSLIGQIDKQNMTVHRWFKSSKSCPGDYLYKKHGYIADEVNKLLGVKSNSINNSSDSTTSKTNTYTVQKGDTLSKIGTKIGVGWKTIASLNGIKFPYVIKVGQVLKLSNTTVITTKPSTSTTTTTSKKFMYNGFDYSLVFNPTYYANHHSDVKRHFGTDETKLFNHFKSYGLKEGRQASANFNPTVYKNRYADLRNAFKDDMQSYYRHYIEYGYKEGRSAT